MRVTHTHTHTHTHTKVGIPPPPAPDLPLWYLSLVPVEAVGWEPRPHKMGRQDAGLVLGGVCGWGGAGGWENCPEETCLLRGDVAHCPGLASRRAGKPKAAHSVLCWWKRGLLSMGSACPGTQPWERTCASLPSETGLGARSLGLSGGLGSPCPPSAAFGGGGSRRCPEAGSGGSDGQRVVLPCEGWTQQPPSSRRPWVSAPEQLEGI